MKECQRMNVSGPVKIAISCAALVLIALGSPAHAGPAAGSSKVADPSVLPASAAVDAEVTLIHASNDADGGIDPRIGKLPSLGNYKSYRLLSRATISLKKSVPTISALPNGRILQIILKDVKDHQFIIDTSINQPAASRDGGGTGGSAFLPLLEVRASVDVPVFIAGQTYQGGMLIIAIKILPR